MNFFALRFCCGWRDSGIVCKGFVGERFLAALFLI